MPYYSRPAEAAIVEHYRVVAEASPVPIVAYNIPVRTGRGLGAASLLELAAIPNVAGVKQAVAALDVDTLEVLADAPAGFSVLSGDDYLAFPMVCMGGAGGITASAHVCTARFVAMVECGLAGKLEDGRHHAEALLPVIETAFAEPNPAVFKGVLHAQGRIATPDVRMPLANASSGGDRSLPRRDRARLALIRPGARPVRCGHEPPSRLDPDRAVRLDRCGCGSRSCGSSATRTIRWASRSCTAIIAVGSIAFGLAAGGSATGRCGRPAPAPRGRLPPSGKLPDREGLASR